MFFDQFSSSTMVSMKKIPRKSTRVARRTIRSIENDDSPLQSSPVAADRNIGAPREVNVPDSMDPNQSPLFMHNADHPGLQLISLRLDGLN